MVCGMFVWRSLCVYVDCVEYFAHVYCEYAFWWFVLVEACCDGVLCSAMLVEWLHLKPCCVEMCGMLFVMYGSSFFSSIFAITERSEMGLYDVLMFMSLFGFGIGIMFASFHV